MARVMLLCAAIVGVVGAAVGVILAFSVSVFLGLAVSGAVVLAFVAWEVVQRRRAAANHRVRIAVTSAAHGRRAAGRPVRHLVAVDASFEATPATAPVAIG